MKICSFLWAYYGYPMSTYEGVNAECMRDRYGELFTGCDDAKVDSVVGVSDSGTAHTIRYFNVSSVPFARLLTKHIPMWPRSFIPTGQMQRNMIAKMKLILVQELIRDECLLLIDDSIVRGAQLGGTTEFLYESGAKEVHVHPACPPIIFGCKYLNLSRSKSEMDLITCRVIRKLEGDDVSSEVLAEYVDPGSERYQKTCEEIRQRSNLTSLRYNRLDDMITSIGLGRCKLCTYCWNGKEDDKEQGKEASSTF